MHFIYQIERYLYPAYFFAEKVQKNDHIKNKLKSNLYREIIPCILKITREEATKNSIVMFPLDEGQVQIY